MKSSFSLPSSLSTIALLLLMSLPAWAVGSFSIRDLTGSGQTARPTRYARTFKQGDIANFPRPSVGGTPLAAWQSTVLNRWPDGSAKETMGAANFTMTAGATVTVDFVNSVNPCSSGNAAACLAAGLNIATMQAYATGWGIEIDTLASSITKTFNAKTMLAACPGGVISSDPPSLGCAYWMVGPLMTAVILKDRTSARAFDAGYSTSASAPYTGATWTSDTTDKPLSPAFEVDFWPGTSYISYPTASLENMWTTHLKDQAYALTIKTGPVLATTAYSKAYFVHYNKNRWRKGADIINSTSTAFWEGGIAPGAVQMDMNLAYIISTGMIPNFDTTKTPSSTGDNTSFAGTGRCDINDRALFTQNMGDTGGRPELGIIPGWYVRALYTMDATAIRNIGLMSDCDGYVQQNVRESQTGLWYDSAHTVDAFGRAWSVDAHPNSRIQDLTAVSGAGVNSTFTGFNLAHQPGFSYIPLTLTGDWYTYESLQLQAANDIDNTDPTTLAYGRNGAMGLINGRAQQTRGEAWGFRDLFQTAFMSIDGSPESTYFNQKLANNIGVKEGWYNITDGAYYNTSVTSPWYWGRNTAASPYEPNPLRFYQYPDCCAGSLGWLQSTVQLMDSPLEFMFEHVALGGMVDAGYPYTKLQQVWAANLLNMLLNPAYNKWLVGAYRIPVFFNSTPNKFATTWAAVKAGYSTSPTNYQTIATWPVADQTDCNAGFTHYAHAATSYLANVTLLPIDGSYSGATAWTWIDDPAQGISTASCLNSNPMWAFKPRSVVAATPVAPSITSSCPLTTATQNSAYSLQLTAAGDPTILWDLSTGAFPTGVTMTTGGLVGGTPTGTGTASFTLRATNSTSPAATQACTLAVNAAPIAPTVTTSTLPGGTVNVAYAQQIVTTGNVPQTCAVTSGSLPTGFTLGSSSCIVGGTTATPGTYAFSVTSTNGVGSSAAKALSIVVAGASGTSNIQVIINGRTVVQGAGVFTINP